MDLSEIQAFVMQVEWQLELLKPVLDQWEEFFAHNATILPVHCKNAQTFLESIVVILSTLDSVITSLPVYQVRNVIQNPNQNIGLVGAFESLWPIVMGNSNEKRILRSSINELFQKLQAYWNDMLADFQAVYGW